MSTREAFSGVRLDGAGGDWSDLTNQGHVSRDRVTALVREHQALVWRFLRALGCEDNLAEDLAQETFLRLYRTGFREESPAATAAWLKRTARNLFVDHLRRTRREVELDQVEEAAAGWESAIPGDGSEELDALRQCLGLVSGKPRDLIRLRYGRDLPLKDAATQTGMTEGAAKVALMRARDQLRDCIQKRLKRK